MRSCTACNGAIPWGTPNCPQCGTRTIWWRLLTTFGVAVGFGTAAVVLVVIGRVWFAPPDDIQWQRSLHAFLQKATDDPLLRGRIGGAGHCRTVIGALCVQLTDEFARADPEEQKKARDRVVASWPTTRVVFIGTKGEIVEPGAEKK